jgi:hypothetical protein
MDLPEPDRTPPIEDVLAALVGGADGAGPTPITEFVQGLTAHTRSCAKASWWMLICRGVRAVRTYLNRSSNTRSRRWFATNSSAPFHEMPNGRIAGLLLIANLREEDRDAAV